MNNVEIREIDSEEVIPLRWKVLRQGLPIETCYFEGDSDPDTFHVGLLIDNEIVAIGTFQKAPYSEQNLDTEFRLRGLATDPNHQSKGFGAKIMIFAEEKLIDLKITRLWFTARIKACKFYERLGYERVGELFDIPTAGPHYKMYKDL
jgi:GNAT superfamily N-acetyltransferase